MPYTIISKEDELNLIKDHFENRVSFNQLQLKYHMSAKRIIKIFANYGLEVQKNIHKGKYSFNKDFFFQENANLAYFLGWVSSDGFIQTNSNLIAIEIQQSDKKVLEDLRKAMEYTRPIANYERKERGSGLFSKFSLENQEIKQLLINKYNITPNKSSDLSFCFNFSNLSKIFWKDYIRGYFDGDGSIKKTGNSLTFQIDSTSLKMLLAIEQALKELDNSVCLAISHSHRANDSDQDIKSKLTVFRLYAYGENAKKVFDVLYKDAEIYLQRKYNRYIQYIK